MTLARGGNDTRKHPHQQSLISVASCAGFTDGVEDMVLLQDMMEAVVKKVLDAAHLVISSCGNRTTVTAEHLLLLARLARVLGAPEDAGKKGDKKAVSTATHRGGAIRMPSEFFGIDSGSYFSDVPVGHQPWNPNVTRTPLYASNPPFYNNMMAGGSAHDKGISCALLDALIKAYNANRTHTVRVAKDAKPLLKELVKENVKVCLKAANSRGTKRLTKSLLTNAHNALATSKISLAGSVCDELLLVFKRAEKTRDAHPGQTIKGRAEGVKKSLDVDLLELEKKDGGAAIFPLVQHLRDGLMQALTVYCQHVDQRSSNIGTRAFAEFVSRGGLQERMYNLQKYEAGTGYYRPHQDFYVYWEEAKEHLCGDLAQSRRPFGRVLTYLWYLNDVDVGGETAIYPDGCDSPPVLVKPSKGKLLLFPATWTYIHSGVMPVSSDKYICTGWLSQANAP